MSCIEPVAAEPSNAAETKRLTRYQRMKRAIDRLRDENEELRVEVTELRDLCALQLQNLDLYRRRCGVNVEELK